MATGGVETKMAAATAGVDAPFPAVQEDVAPDAYEADSAYDSEVASYTTSLASSAVDYKYENGRRYHAYKEGAYIYPNDEKESERLDLAHKLLEVAMGGKLWFAPLEDPKRILDLGTGTGIWCIEMADQFPQADILGNDLSPIQPRWVPPNVHFEIDDVEQPWTYASKFDFVHCRCMYSAIQDWPKLVGQSFEFIKPGAYAEFVDFDVEYISPDNSLVTGSDVHNLNRMFIDQTRKMNIEPCPGKYLEKWMKAAGFEGVTATKRFLPLGTWPADKHLKEVGAWNFMMIDEFLESFLNYLYSKHLGMSKEEINVACAKIRKQLRDPKVHCMYTLWICYGRKPMSSVDHNDDDEKSKTVDAKEEGTKEEGTKEEGTKEEGTKEEGKKEESK